MGNRLHGAARVVTHDVHDAAGRMIGIRRLPEQRIFNTDVEDYQFDFVGVDNRQGAFNAVRHLIELGHCRIGTVAGLLSVTSAQERLQGYKDALLSTGLPVDDALIGLGEYEQEPAYHATHTLLDLPTPPTALFVANEPMVVGAFDALRERKLRVPQDVALVGFDDTPWMEHIHPPVTTVAQPTYAVGREAVRLLIRRLSKPDASCLTVMLQTKLNIRQSCGYHSG